MSHLDGYSRNYTMYEFFIRYKIPILIALVSEVIILFSLGRVSVYLFPQLVIKTRNKKGDFLIA